MPPKKIHKKGALTDEEISKTIAVVKQYWPDYPIAITNIRKPTREFVLKFYSDYVANIDDICAFVTKTKPPVPPNLSVEETLFLKMSMIPHLSDIDFKLSDLFVFEPKRLNTHMLVSMAFLMQIESLMDKVVTISNRAFNQATEMEQAKVEIQKLKINTLQRQIDLTTAKEELKKVTEIADELAPKYSNVLELIENTKEKCKDTISEIANIKSKQDHISEEINGIRELESELQKQLVTKEEMDNLKATYDQLVKKEKLFTEQDVDNNILISKQQLEKMQCCLQELDCLDLPQELYALADIRTELKNEKWNISHLATSQESTKIKIDQLKTDLEKKELAMYQENTSLLEALEKINKSGMEEYLECQIRYRNLLESKERLKQTSEEELVSKTEEYHEAVTTLQEKYNILVNKQSLLAQNFEHFLNKVNMLIRQ